MYSPRCKACSISAGSVRPRFSIPRTALPQDDRLLEMMGRRTLEHPAHAGVEIIAVCDGGRDELRMDGGYKKNEILGIGIITT
jgi:hypothetical protein